MSRSLTGPRSGDAERAYQEITGALQELARLVSDGVPGCDGASVSLLTDGRPSTLAASSEPIRDLDEAQYARDNGPCVQAMRERTEVRVQDYVAESRWPDVSDDLRDAGMRSSLSLPLADGEQVLGGLNMYGSEAGAFSAGSRQAAHAFARQAVLMLGYLQQLHVVDRRGGRAPLGLVSVLPYVLPIVIRGVLRGAPRVQQARQHVPPRAARLVRRWSCRYCRVSLCVPPSEVLSGWHDAQTRPTGGSAVRTRRGLVVLVAAVSFLLVAAPVGAAPSDRSLRQTEVATYNLFLGGDIGSLLAPGVDTLPEFGAAATALWQDVVASDFPQRAEAVADLLAEDHPDVVGLQEVALWQATPLAPGAPAPSYDFLAILLAELAERGTPYQVLATNTNFVSPTIPLPIGVAVQYTDRDVIIARADLQTSQLKVLGTESRNFEARVPVTLPFSAVPGQATTQISVVRGWSSVDIKLRGKIYRFVNTHLESFTPVVRRAQAVELAAALASSPFPVVLVGDLNADPGTEAVALLVDALGLTDAWETGTGAGLTSGQRDLRGPASFDRRIDYVLYESDRRPDLEALGAEVIGEEPGDRTASGLWPSDHAGVLATIRITTVTAAGRLQRGSSPTVSSG